MKVKIKKWNAVGTWKYNIGVDECMICQNEFEIPCSKCNNPSDCVPGKFINKIV